jgi:hypothetical protein
LVEVVDERRVAATAGAGAAAHFQVNNPLLALARRSQTVTSVVSHFYLQGFSRTTIQE